jgi:hypothetical protein
MKQPTVRRLTLIIRLQAYRAAPDWRGQVEMVNPHREAVFRSRDELWHLLETWTASSSEGANRRINESAKERTEKTRRQE